MVLVIVLAICGGFLYFIKIVIDIIKNIINAIRTKEIHLNKIEKMILLKLVNSNYLFASTVRMLLLEKKINWKEAWFDKIKIKLYVRQ